MDWRSEVCPITILISAMPKNTEFCLLANDILI